MLSRVGLYTPMERVSSKSSLSSDDRGNKTSGRAQPIKSLSDEVSEGGNNFSVGQRQLLVIGMSCFVVILFLPLLMFSKLT